MRILSIRTINGPNVYHHHPVLIMRIDLESHVELRSDKIPNFIPALVNLLPGITGHTCSIGKEGGFIQRLKSGTYLGHIIEHLALELITVAGSPVSFGKTVRAVNSLSQFEVVVGFRSEPGMRCALEQAVNMTQHLLSGQFFDLQKALHQIREALATSRLGISTAAILDAAQKRGIPCRILPGDGLIQLGQGRKMRRMHTAVSDKTNLVSADIAQDKELTKQILREYFIPVPRGQTVQSVKELRNAIKSVPPPYVIKPMDGNHGRAVSLNLQNENEVLRAFALAKKYSDKVVIEEMIFGRDYRLLMVDGKMVAAAERIPPHVCGDGISTVENLIDKLNMQPGRDVGHESILTKIEPDSILVECLRKQKLNLKSVPKKDQLVCLRPTGNLSSGATAIDVTEKVHPEIVKLCERAARAIGLDICGIDLIHNDISEPADEDVKIIEINAGPGLRMHLVPSAGKPRAVGDSIIDMLYPEDNGRIPIVAVTGTNGKTTVVRLLHKILSLSKDQTVGMTSTDGIWVGSQKIVSGDMTGPKSTRLLLADTNVDAAVLEVARGGLKRNGLGYDWADIGIITNIRTDHIGQDGIEDLEDLVWIKSLVAERVRENGTIILNADDPLSLQLKYNSYLQKGNRHIFLYSTSTNNRAIQEHVNCGNSACWVEGDTVYIKHQNYSGPLYKIASIPITLNGLAEFQVSNILAVTAAAITAGISSLQIIRGMQTFIPAKENLGRVNLFKVKAGYVILDYGHNEDAISAIGKILNKFGGFKKTAVLGLPGDRHNRLIEDTGKAAGNIFDKFVLRDDVDLRGRKSGEIPAILQNAIQIQNLVVDCKTVLNPLEATRHALRELSANEIVVVFYEKLHETLSVLKEFDAEAISNIQEEPIHQDILNIQNPRGVWWHAVTK